MQMVESKHARGRGAAAAGAVAIVAALAAFLVMVGEVTSHAADDALARSATIAAAGAGAAPATRPDRPSTSSTRSPADAATSSATVTPAGAGARPAGPAGPAGPATTKATPTVARTTFGTLAAPHFVPVPTGAGTALYVPPTVTATAVTGCRASAGGGGVVTYTATLAGGAAWAPAGNFHNGAFTIDVQGGTGIDAVITGAPLTDTADRTPVYVAFPARLVLDARC